MKIILSQIIFFMCIAVQAISQNNVISDLPSKDQELIIYMPHVDRAKTLQTVIDIVQTNKNIIPVAFCDDLKCLLLRVTGDHPEKAQRLFEDLKNAGFEFEIKSNGTIEQVLNQSHDILNEKTHWQ